MFYINQDKKIVSTTLEDEEACELEVHPDLTEIIHLSVNNHKSFIALQKTSLELIVFSIDKNEVVF